jgi:protease-4
MRKEKIVIALLFILFIVSIALTISTNRHLSRKTKGESLLLAPKGIAVLYITGTIAAASPANMFSQANIESIIEELISYEKDKRVRAIVLRINSPGGTAGAAQELYQEIMQVKKRAKVPIVVSIGDIGASGAYWAALAGDTIFANASSLVGSIGVIVNNLDLSQVPSKYGIGMHTIKSGQYKDLLSNWRVPNKDEKAIVSAVINNIHAQFVQDIVTSRKIKKAQVLKLADGRIFSGAMAQKAGLVDKLGGLQNAINYTAKLAGIKGTPEIIVKSPMPMYKLLNFFKTTFSSLFTQNYLSTIMHKIPSSTIY